MALLAALFVGGVKANLVNADFDRALLKRILQGSGATKQAQHRIPIGVGLKKTRFRGLAFYWKRVVVKSS